jgi:Flp pilus assembly protein TadG
MTRTSGPRRRRRDGGQTLVEFALALPLFALVLFGVFDVGRFVYANSVLSQAAREGARLAAAEGAWVGRTGDACVANESLITTSNPGAHVCPADASVMKANVVTAVHRMTAGVGSISGVYLSCNDGDGADPAPAGEWTDSSGGNGCLDPGGTYLGGSGGLVSVRVAHTFQPITPIISTLVGSLPLSGSATMVIN